MSERKVRHPAVSDIALALATRRSDPTSKVALTLNAKGDVQIEVDVNDADPAAAAKIAADLFDVLRAKYPRENGAKP
jgi:capsular polysaccharide biosynthesis protein